METFIAQLVSGLATGSTYALILTGMNLLLLVRGVVHFGYAYIVVMTMCVGWLVLGATDNNLYIAIPAFIVAGTAITILTEPLFRRLALKHAFLETLVMAQGVAIILIEVISHFINKGEVIAFPDNLTRGGAVFHFGKVSFSLPDIYTLAGSIVVVLVLLYILYRRKQGRAIRAMAQSLETARLLGIPFNRTGIYGFTIAGVLAGVIAILVSMTLGSASAGLGDVFSNKAIILMLFAGAGNLIGGMVCAMLIGIAEAMALFYLPGRWTDAIIFGIIMVAILWRPGGMFGERT